MDWISSGMPSSFNPAPDPSKMWDWENVHDALDACRTSRDRALITLQMDAGMASGELRNLRLDSFADGKYALQVHVAKGKEGERSVNLIPSAPHVRAWREDHPADPTADVPLRTTEDSSSGDCQQIAYHTFRDAFANVADRAGIANGDDLLVGQEPLDVSVANRFFRIPRGIGYHSVGDRSRALASALACGEAKDRDRRLGVARGVVADRLKLLGVDHAGVKPLLGTIL